MSMFLCGPEHIGQVVGWARVYGPDGDAVGGAEALARANLRSLSTRYRLDMFPDWESKMAQKFGGYEDNEEYVRLCVLEAMESCRLTAASIANMCACLAYQSRDFAGWEGSMAKLYLDRVTAAAIEAAWPDPRAVELGYRC